MKLQRSAALFLGNEGAEGVRHLPALLKACGRIDPDRAVMCFEEATLLSSGAISTGAVLNAVGFDPSDQLHRTALDWLLRLSRAKNPEPVAGAIYGLERVGIPPNEVRVRLCELVVAPLSTHDHPIVTARALAFRALARIDRPTAEAYLKSRACTEYRACIDHWIAQSGQYTTVTGPEDLLRESQWLDEYGC